MNWDDLRHFGALASAGSLSGAARALGVEHATVARRVAALEQTLGVALVDRRGRRWSLTAEGERIATIADRMENEAHAARRAADGSRSDISGTVTVSAPPALAVAALAGPLVDLQLRNPGLTVRVVGEVRSASLERGEADIALRLTRPEGGELTIVKLGELCFRLYASSNYLATRAASDWCFVGSEGLLAMSPQHAALETFAASRTFSFYASSLEMQQAAARAGAGIAALPEFLAEADRGLQRVLPDMVLIARELWLVVHSDLARAAHVRAVMQQLRHVFSKG